MKLRVPHASFAGRVRRPRILRRTLGAALAVSLVVPALSGAAEMDGGGCPFFTPPREYYQQPDVDPDHEVGQFGWRSQRITGLSLDVDGGILTATVQVEEMKKQVPPGSQSAFWAVYAQLSDDYYDPTSSWVLLWAGYHFLEDRFWYRLELGSGNEIERDPLTGTEVMGPGGSVSIPVPIERLGVSPGSVISHVEFLSGGFTEQTVPGGPRFSQVRTRWYAAGPEFFPLIPCPGVTLRVEYAGTGKAVAVDAWVLPQRPATATVEELVDEGNETWAPVAELPVDEDGRVFGVVAMDLGSHTVRLRIPTDAGEVVSEPQTVEVG